MRSLLIMLFILFNFIVTTQVVAQEKLIFAIDVIRHGDRTPLTDIPKAPHHWEGGLGQLTAVGMKQEYLLGTNLRKLYVDKYHLLPSNYSAGTIYIRSTNMDRTLMSAQSFLLGLYPLGTGPRLPESKQLALSQGFQPIPIHTVAIEQETLLFIRTESPKFKEYFKRYISPSLEWQQKTADLQPKFSAWSQATGITITDLSQLTSLGDTLYINQLKHVPLPVGLSSKDAQQIIDTGHWVFVTAFKSLEVGESTGNELLKTLSNYFQQATQQKTPLKYILFSSHDSTLLSLMSAMSAPLNEAPPYASDLNFSLFDKGQQNYYVKIKFNGKSVRVRECSGDICSLQQFNALVK